MKDEIFGVLTYDYLWEGVMQIKLYGEIYTVALCINGEEDEKITQIQRDAYMMYKKMKMK